MRTTRRSFDIMIRNIPPPLNRFNCIQSTVELLSFFPFDPGHRNHSMQRALRGNRYVIHPPNSNLSEYPTYRLTGLLPISSQRFLYIPVYSCIPDGAITVPEPSRACAISIFHLIYLSPCHSDRPSKQRREEEAHPARPANSIASHPTYFKTVVCQWR
ncbi:hypothetical protein BDN72DRAFT_529867 [Pluteus cervinus]|uniref:Uncharacterized protein n=1 Tax=Pluteus cervinus TaxID=181527 RepID=A0ACD3AZ92_9AGAR|nr:hypothetical protein BDN72DRAFT_529867 [Pluteus cervinus]